jgi:hypothetical protein
MRKECRIHETTAKATGILGADKKTSILERQAFFVLSRFRINSKRGRERTGGNYGICKEKGKKDIGADNGISARDHRVRDAYRGFGRS